MRFKTGQGCGGGDFHRARLGKIGLRVVAVVAFRLAALPIHFGKHFRLLLVERGSKDLGQGMVKLITRHQPISATKVSIHRIKSTHHISRLLPPAAFREFSDRIADQLQAQIAGPIPAGAQQLLAQRIHAIKHPCCTIAANEDPSTLAPHQEGIILQSTGDTPTISEINRRFRPAHAVGQHLQFDPIAPFKHLAQVLDCSQQRLSAFIRHHDRTNRLQRQPRRTAQALHPPCAGATRLHRQAENEKA